MWIHRNSMYIQAQIGRVGVNPSEAFRGETIKLTVTIRPVTPLFCWRGSMSDDSRRVQT